MTDFRRTLTGFLVVSVVLCTVRPAWGTAAISRITDINVDSQGNLVLNVEGEGFDPLLHLEPVTGKSYRVVLRAASTAAVATLQSQLQAALPEWQKGLPVLESVRLQAQQSNGQPQTTLYLDVCQKLLPQIRSNTGSQIVIALVGNHQLSPGAGKAEVPSSTTGLMPASSSPVMPTVASISARVPGKKPLSSATKSAPASGKMPGTSATANKERFPSIRQLQRTSTATDTDLAWASFRRSEQLKLAQAHSGAVTPVSSDSKPSQTPETSKMAVSSASQSSLALGSLDIDPLLPAHPPRREVSRLSGSKNTDAGAVMLALADPATPPSLKSVARSDASSNTEPPEHHLMLAQAGPQFLSGTTAKASRQMVEVKEPEEAPASPLQLKKTPPDFEIDDPVAIDKADKPLTRPSVRNTRMDPSLYAVVSNPNADPAFRAAWESLMNGQGAQAESQLKAYLEQDPANAAARFLLARVLLMPQVGEIPFATASARRDEARKQLAMAIARNVHAPSFVDLIELTLEDDKIPVAERLWERLNGWQPDDSMTYYAHGRILEAKDDLGGARDAYKKALAQQPDNPAFHYRLAQVELKATRLDAAWWELGQALMVYPDDGRLWKQMAFLAEKRNQPQQAMKYYRQSIPTDALLGYGHLLASQNQPDKAMLYYNAAEDLAGDDIDLLFNLGMLYTDLKRDDRAEKVLTRFLALDQDVQDNRVGSAKATLMKLKAHPSGKFDKSRKK